jgi:hypothetical protein
MDTFYVNHYDVAYQHLVSSCRTRFPIDLAKQSILLRSAKNTDKYESVRRMILDARSEWVDYLSRSQRGWQSKVSNKPWKGNHHDSWAMREGYVRCHGSYTDYIKYAHEKQLEHGWQTAKVGKYPCRN